MDKARSKYNILKRIKTLETRESGEDTDITALETKETQLKARVQALEDAIIKITVTVKKDGEVVEGATVDATGIDDETTNAQGIAILKSLSTVSGITALKTIGDVTYVGSDSGTYTESDEVEITLTEE